MERKEPSLEELRMWMIDGIAEAVDGCVTEVDGVCEHGCNSWLIELGYM